jgi:medium-chain acyl-[acyl-carrier-protein] hydrolase
LTNLTSEPKGNIQTNTWITRFDVRPGARLRLFCFPYAGGASHAFRLWPNGLPQSLEVCAVQPPGRGSRLREIPFKSFPPLVEAATQAMLPYLDKPFALFGHSLGALVAFEVARSLRRQHGLTPARLLVAGHRAPSISHRQPPISDLPEPAFIEKLRSFNGTPPEVLENAELISLMLPMLRADFAVLEDYRYTEEAPLGCGISAFGGLQDEEASREELDGWREQTSADFTLQIFPGGHFFLHTAQARLLQLIAAQLS